MLDGGQALPSVAHLSAENLQAFALSMVSNLMGMKLPVVLTSKTESNAASSV